MKVDWRNGAPSKRCLELVYGGTEKFPVEITVADRSKIHVVLSAGGGELSVPRETYLTNVSRYRH